MSCSNATTKDVRRIMHTGSNTHFLEVSGTAVFPQSEFNPATFLRIGQNAVLDKIQFDCLQP